MTRMKFERLSRQLTQEALAKKTGLPRTVISRLESQYWIRCPLRYETKLKAFFGESFKELMRTAPPESSGKETLRAWRGLQKQIA